jgi:hypothetical protein
MTPEQLIAWAQAAQLLIAAGVGTAAQLRAIFAAGGMTEEEQNAVLDKIIANAGVRKRRSKAIAEGT